MDNDRLRSTMRLLGYTPAKLADEVGVDTKTVERWLTRGHRTPYRRTAERAAALLNVPASWLWPDLDQTHDAKVQEFVALYAHRSETPRTLWMDLVLKVRHRLDVVTYASLFLPEENPEAVELIKHKAANGCRVRIALGDPDSPEIALRGEEEGLGDAIAGRVRMALAYYRPLVDAPGVEFHLHRTTMYNSIFRFDDDMLVNQHAYGTYGYIAPVLQLRRAEGADLFDTYMASFEKVWAKSYAMPTTAAARS